MIRSMSSTPAYKRGWEKIFGNKRSAQVEEEYLDEPNGHPKFVVVCGPGRSGTSLACELVKNCGFSFGQCNPMQMKEWDGLRSGYNENPLSNAQGKDVLPAIAEILSQNGNAVKLIHLYAQWIPKLLELGFDVRIVVTSRELGEIWDSGTNLYRDWKPGAVGPICGQARRILDETAQYLDNPKYKAYHLPFQKVVEKDQETLEGLVEFLREDWDKDNVEQAVRQLKKTIKPDIVQHAKENPLKDELSE